MYARSRRHALLLITATAMSGALAAPAPWYWWQSRVDGRHHCAQASPGAGWQRDQGPYLDLRCTQPVPARMRDGRIEPGQPETRSPGETRIDRLKSK